MSAQFCSGSMAAGDGRAGAAPMSSLMDSGAAGTIGTMPELADRARGAATGDDEPLMADRLCGDLQV